MKTRSLVVFGLAAVVLAGLGAEALVRGRAHARFGEYLDIYDLHERLPGSDLLVPLADLDTEFGGATHIVTDEHGFRSPPVPQPKPEGTLRLAFLGASTTFCSQARDAARTWPGLVAAELARRRPALRVDYVNAGVTSYLVADSALGLEERVAAVQPDVVVIYHAANDLAVDTHELAVVAGLAKPAGEPGWLEEHSLLYRLIRKNRRYQAAQAEGGSDGPKLDCDLEALARGFEDRLVDLVERASETAELVVLPRYATRFDRSQPREMQLTHMAQSFTFMAYLTPEALFDGFEAYDRAIARAAERTGALLIDDVDELQGCVPCFTDSVHLSERGCEVMARRIVEGLEECEEFRRLAEGRLATASSPSVVEEGG